jgi:phosphotransacetylase
MGFYVNRSKKKPVKKKDEKGREYLVLAGYDENMIIAKAQEELEKEFVGQTIFAPETVKEKMKGIKTKVDISIIKKNISEKLQREIDAAKKKPCKKRRV